MPSEVILPRVDMDMATGKIAKWFVENGAAVTKGQPLFEIETDKAAMEIEAPATGTIRDLAAVSGADIPVGSVVAWIFGEGETAEALAPVASAPARQAAPPEAPAATAPPAQAAPAAAAPPTGPENRPRATPVARRLARVDGIDLGSIIGSGPRGRIQAADIVAARRPAKAPVTPVPPAIALAEAPSPAAPPPAIPTPAAALAREEVPSSPSAPTPARVAAGDGALNMLTLREGTGRPTLLIHGFGADANSWRPMLAGRSSARPVLGLDLPGHGGSPLGPVAAFPDLVDAIEGHLRGSDLGAFDLVGHSLGGALAAALAARGTLDIRSLLLLAPAGLGPAINGAFIDGFLRATTEASLTPWMAELVGDPAALTPAFVRATLKARQGTGLAASQSRIAAAVFPDGTQAFGIRADLARMPVPCRVLLGTADRILPAAQADGLPGRIAVHRYAGIGHMPMVECREEVLAIMAEMAGAGG